MLYGKRSNQTLISSNFARSRILSEVTYNGICWRWRTTGSTDMLRTWSEGMFCRVLSLSRSWAMPVPCERLRDQPISIDVRVHRKGIVESFIRSDVGSLRSVQMVNGIHLALEDGKSSAKMDRDRAKFCVPEVPD